MVFECTLGGMPLWARILGPGSTDANAVYGCSTEAELVPMMGDVRLAPGSYTIQVSKPTGEGARHTGGYTGRYDLYLYRLDGAPEQASQVVAVGDTIEGESLDPPGDADNFILRGHRGDDVDIQLYGLDERWVQSMDLLLGYSGGRTDPLGIAYWEVEGDLSHGTDHVVLPADGDYPIKITGGNIRRDNDGAAPYRVIVHKVSRAVEHHAARISVGDSVTDERLDDWNDLDEFIVTGAPGQLVIASAREEPGTMGVRLEAVEPATRETLAFTSSNSYRPSGTTLPFALDSAGEAAVRLYRAIDVIPGEVGAYEFGVYVFSTAPENVSATIAIGDTVRGESIDRPGDVDEYIFDGAAGDTLSVYFNPISSPDHTMPLVLEVLGSESDDPLGSIQIGVGAELGDWQTGAFVLPESGSYIVRVRGFNYELGSGEYEFTLQRAR
jgi:hypothetical protein